MVIAYELPLLSYSISVRYREGCRQKVIGHLQQLYEERFPGMAFRYTEYEFSQLYNRDMALVKMIHIFTAIAILVGGMGILAFSMFMAESRRKEVALRKVNGAGVGQIILLLPVRTLRKPAPAVPGTDFIGLCNRTSDSTSPDDFVVEGFCLSYRITCRLVFGRGRYLCRICLADRYLANFPGSTNKSGRRFEERIVIIPG